MADRGAGMKARAKRLTADEASTGIPAGGSGGLNSKQAGAKPHMDDFAEIRGTTKAQKRLDKFARGGKVKAKGKTNINIVIAQQPSSDQGQGQPMMPPMPPKMPAAPPPPPPAAAPGGAPPPGMGGPQGGPTIVMPPGGAGGPPMPPKASGGRVGMFKRGGKVKHHAAPAKKEPPAPARNNIGRRYQPASAAPPMPMGDADGDEGMPMAAPPMKKGGRACRASGGSVKGRSVRNGMEGELAQRARASAGFKRAVDKVMNEDGGVEKAPMADNEDVLRQASTNSDAAAQTGYGKPTDFTSGYKRGGRLKRADGGEVTEKADDRARDMAYSAAGARVKEVDSEGHGMQIDYPKDRKTARDGYQRGGAPKMTAGRGSGLGRMQAARNQKACD